MAFGVGGYLRRAGITLVVALVCAIFPYSAYPEGYESVVAAAKPSIGVLLAEGPGGIVSGTAFLVANGQGMQLIITAEHVVAGARREIVQFPGHPPVELPPGELVSLSDPEGNKRNDVAALLAEKPLPIRPLPVGEMGQVREGETVLVIGYPRTEALGVQVASVTVGIVSAIRGTLIQIQAPVSPGSSGSPVLNVKGQVIGIVLGTLTGPQQGINFATSIDVVKRLFF